MAVDLRSRRPGSSLYLVTTPNGEGLAGNVGSLRAGRARPSGLARNVLSPPRIARRRRASRAGRVVQLARRLSSPGRARPRRARAPLRHHRQCRPLVVRAGRRARAGRRILRQPPRAQPHRRHDRHGAHHHGRRSCRPAAGRRHRRRARPARRQRQRHARAHRGVDARSQGGFRQHRPRSEDAADAAAQSLRAGAAQAEQRSRIPRGAGIDDRGIRRAHPHLRCAVDDRARRIRPGARQYDRVRRRRDRPRCRRALRAAGRARRALRSRSMPPAAAPVRGNRELVSQALANLVDNAIKYAARTATSSTASRRRSWSEPATRASASC